jgi:hypothetical protein
MTNITTFLVIGPVGHDNLKRMPGRATRQLSQLVEQGRQLGFIMIAGNDYAKTGHDPFH